MIQSGWVGKRSILVNCNHHVWRKSVQLSEMEIITSSAEYIYLSIANKEFYMSCVYTKVGNSHQGRCTLGWLYRACLGQHTVSNPHTHTSIRLIQGPPFWTSSSVLLFFCRPGLFWLFVKKYCCCCCLLTNMSQILSLASSVSQFNNNLGLGTHARERRATPNKIEKLPSDGRHLFFSFSFGNFAQPRHVRKRSAVKSLQQQQQPQEDAQRCNEMMDDSLAIFYPIPRVRV
jgi:hypothetical protein